MFKEKIIPILISIVFCCLLLCSIYVYGEKGTDYVIDDVQIQCLFESEQEILETYNVSFDNEDVIIELKNDISCLGYQESISTNQNISDSVVLTIENMVYQGVGTLIFSELKEEIYVGNKLAAREMTLSDVGSFEETTDEKLYRLFGSRASELQGRVLYYPGGEEEALQYMESFYVTVWDLNENEEWYQREQLLTSHYTLVKTLKCIFSELLELPEEDRVPIKSIGCYHYREGSSAHTCGAAIDINWEENAEMTISGVITAGYFWDPEGNIYSIKADSPFVHIFEKYGWTWGGYWTSKKDYMHFSYLDR